MNKTFKIFYEQSQFMVEALELSKTSIYNLHKILSKNKINYCIIGAAAMIPYDYARMTDDIDILVDVKDKEKLLNISPGYIKTFNNTECFIRLVEPRINIDVIYSNDIGDDKGHFRFPNPKKVLEYIDINNTPVPFLTLKNLILFKLRSGIYKKGRLKDLGDIQVLIQNNNLTEDFAKDFKEDLKMKFIEILNS